MSNDKDKDKDKSEMTEWEKRLAGEPYDTAKLYQEMDDHALDSIIEGVSKGSQKQQPQTPQPKA